MRIDKYTMAQSWMRQDDASPEEAKSTWDTLEKDFEDKRKILLASAETDEIIKTIDDKFGPGTLFPASEAPIPPKTLDRDMWESANERLGFNDGQLVTPNVDGSRPGYSGEYPVNISKEGNSFRVKLLNGKRKSVKDLDAAIELLKSDGQTVKYLGADQKQVLDWVKSQTEPITTDDIAKYIADNNLSVRRSKITNIIKDNPEYENKVKLVIKKTDFLNKNGTIKQGTVDEITKMINNSKDFPTMQSIAKALDYKGTIKNIINQWSAQTGNDIPFERFRVHTYRDTEIAEKIIKAFDAQGDNPNIAKLARQFQKEMPGVNSFNSARNQIRKILVDYADYEPRPNEPKSANEMSYYKKRRQNIALALKRMGDTTIKDQMDEILYNKNQEYVKLANENPNKILNNKKLRFALETTVDVDTGEFKIRNDGKGLSDNEILKRVKRGDLFTEDHITEVRTAETAPKKSGEGIKLTKGVNIEYPTNKQAVTINFNQSFLPNAQKYLTENPNGKNVQKIVDVLNDYGLQIKAGDKTYGTTEKIAWDKKTKTSPRYNSNFNIFDSSKDLDFNKEIQNYITGKTNKPPMFSSGLAGAYDQLMSEPAIKALINSEGFKNFSKVAKTPGKFFGIGDVALGYLDFINNKQKGQSDQLASKNALQAMSLGLWKGGDRKRLEEVKELAVKNGMDEDVFDSITYMNEKQNLFQNTINQAKFKYDDFKKAGMDADAEQIKIDAGKRLTKIMGDITTGQSSLQTNVRVAEAGAPININVDDKMLDAYKDVRETGIDYRTQQAKEAYDTQKRLLHPEAGKIGNWLLTNIFTTDARKKAQEQAYIDDMEERELFLYNRARGISPDQPLSGKGSVEFMLQNPELFGHPTSYFDGGIASLRRKK